ncbi:ankyrin-2 ankyrin [Colletotrichum chrysophilum]|uniref:Ankyrin-2 ankyrin n=1 Tax=Colletotrichum chrysophilum TaxID=1836956 RepID=A0AAD9EDA4_9PEZI|nr:ankyrin-2 ankyrin [Colletotrichum chrysophilum]
MTDQTLYENAHEALGGDFVVPRHDPISEESLAKLPIGVQIRHMIRKLRLAIQRGGSCDFKPLSELARQLAAERSTLEGRFRLTLFNHFGLYSYDLTLCITRAAFSPIVSREFLSEPFIRIWVRDCILGSAYGRNRDYSFPITRFAEIWNADSDSTNLFTLAGGEAGPFETMSLLYIAVICNKPRVARILIRDDPNQDLRTNFEGYNAFHYAAFLGFVDCYRELWQCNGAKTMESKRGLGDLPLHIAALHGHKHMVEYLLSVHSDDKDHINARNSSAKTPLMVAAMSGASDVVQFLLGCPEVDLTASDREGKTALDYAGEKESVFLLILSKLPDQYFNTLLELENTPLHRLAERAGQKAMQLVLSLPSIMPDKEDGDGETPLCYAVRSGNLEAVKALGIRRDVNVMKLSTALPKYPDSLVEFAKDLAKLHGSWSQILDWLKIHCKELEVDLADWGIRDEGGTQGAGGYQQNSNF